MSRNSWHHIAALWLVPLAWLTCGGAVASAAGLPGPVLQALTASGLPASSLSVWVQPVEGGAPRLSHQADTPRQIASVMKLVTTGVALRVLGPAYVWSTPVALAGRLDGTGVLRGSVHIRASGDPSLDGMRLAAAVRQLRGAGLRDIRGDVLVDRSVFALPPHDPAAFDAKPLRAYNAGPDAWLLAHGAVTLRFRPDAARAGWAQVSMDPLVAGTRLDTDVPLDPRAPCGEWREALALSLEGPDAARTVKLRGPYPVACGERDWPIRWPQIIEGAHSAGVFTAAWLDAGGRLRGQVRDTAWPPGAVPWITWTSPPLAEVVRDINKFSNNVMARQLFLTLGRGRDGGAATLEQARTTVGEHVRTATRTSSGSGPCDDGALVLDNGAGLSRLEAATARCLARWTQVMWADPLMPEWLASLPVAGMDGTARRMSAAVGRAHIKTGSLDGVAALAGVVQDARGQRHVVVAIVNDPRSDQARGVLLAVLAWAAD